MRNKKSDKTVNCNTDNIQNDQTIANILKNVQDDPNYKETTTAIHTETIENELPNYLEKENKGSSENRTNRDNSTTTLYQKYVYDYSNKADDNRKYRKIIFYTILSSIIILTAAIIVGFVLTAKLEKDTGRMIVIITTSCVTYLGSLFIVVEIITKHLFPPYGEKYVNDIAKAIIHNDLESRKFDNEQ